MRLAQQSLQSDFDPNLVRMFDKYAQGWVGQTVVAAGESVSVSVDGAAAQAIQGLLTSDFGFADFVNDTAAVRVARPVAVAETGAAPDDDDRHRARCARTARTTCGSPSTGSTTSPARSTASMPAKWAMPGSGRPRLSDLERRHGGRTGPAMATIGQPGS